MDKRKTYSIILDTETIGTTENKQALIYDIGYVVADKQGKIYERVNHLVKEIFEDKELMSTAYFAEKVPTYLTKVKSKNIDIVNFKTIIRELQTIVKEYNIKNLCAYNLNFDITALEQTTQYIYPNLYKLKFEQTKQGKYKPLIKEFITTNILKHNVNYVDLWTQACQTICQNKTYKNNAKLTKSGNIITNAEEVYKYITLNDNFVEDHTALSDAEIETEIFTKLNSIHKHKDQMIFNPWQKVKKD